MAIAASVTFLCTPIARHLARYVHAVTPVRDRDVHSTPTPRLGGLAMLTGLVVAVLAASNIPFLAPVFTDTAQVWGLLAGAIWVSLLGVADDLWDLDWWAKLGGQILAGLMLAWSGILIVTFPIAGLTIGSSRLSVVATVFVIVAAINAVNFVDGLDGLAAGLVGIGGTAFFVYTYLLTRVSSPENYTSKATAIIAALVGVCVGFLPHNFNPARIFMGDSGSMLLGLTVAAASIVVTGKIDPARVSLGQAVPVLLPIILPLAVLALPLLDMLLAVARRLRAGQSPFQADRMHLHHRLLDLGHSHRSAVLVMYMWTAVFSLGAASLALFPTRYVLAGTGVLAVLAAALTRRQLTRT
jgi:UDP-GlcNAc:undecaprenyl-phosphate GlcNAc-1-phosphate transferase